MPAASPLTTVTPRAASSRPKLLCHADTVRCGTPRADNGHATLVFVAQFTAHEKAQGGIVDLGEPGRVSGILQGNQRCAGRSHQPFLQVYVRDIGVLLDAFGQRGSNHFFERADRRFEDVTGRVEPRQ